ncbi:MAG: outer membrane protein assembly factor BamD [Anaeromyxobacter sp.]
MRRLALVFLLVLAAPACRSKYTTITGELKLGQTPEDNYKRGVAELDSKNWPEAIRFFEYVKAKYPYSKFAALSDLRLADLKYKQELYPEAAAAYEEFSKLHPTSEELDFAEYRAGLSHFLSAPGDWFIFPPAFEKDQRETEKAVQLLTDFVQTRTGSKYLPEAQKTLAEARRRLEDREWYVAGYYYKRERWAGAALRYEGLIKNYPGSKYETEAMLRLAQSLANQDEKFRARQALQQLLSKHPDAKEKGEAEKLLESLR